MKDSFYNHVECLLKYRPSSFEIEKKLEADLLNTLSSYRFFRIQKAKLMQAHLAFCQDIL